MQVQPVIRKIINELAVDADKFFDEVAFLNEQENSQASQDSRGPQRSLMGCFAGLNKRLFFS